MSWLCNLYSPPNAILLDGRTTGCCQTFSWGVSLEICHRPCSSVASSCQCNTVVYMFLSAGHGDIGWWAQLSICRSVSFTLFHRSLQTTCVAQSIYGVSKCPMPNSDTVPCQCIALNDMCEAGESNVMMYVAFLAMSGTWHIPGMPAVICECELSQVPVLMFRQAWFQVDVAAQIWVLWAEKSVAPVSSLSEYYLLALSQDIS